MDDRNDFCLNRLGGHWPIPPLEFYLLGLVDFRRVYDLQRKLMALASCGQARSVPVLLCEHPSLITVGRKGSRRHVRLTAEQLRRRNLAVEWVARSGGCIPHLPGQLAAYPIIPLHDLGWTTGEYVERLQTGLQSLLAALNIRSELRSGSRGVWGRTGLLAAIGINVRRGISSHGVYVNVCPDMSIFGHIDTVPRETRSSMSCVFAERRGPVRMANVRTSLIECLSQAFGYERYHIHSGHPWLRTNHDAARGSRDAI